VKDGRSTFKLEAMKSALFVAKAAGSTGQVLPDEENQGGEEQAQ
jgi:hypothetical protein